MQSLGTRLKYTEQYCMSNIITTHLVSSTVIPCMHTSQRIKEEYRQLSRLELKRSQKLAGGLRGGIDAIAHALRVIDVYTVYSAQPIYTLSHASANSGKVKKLRIDK